MVKTVTKKKDPSQLKVRRRQPGDPPLPPLPKKRTRPLLRPGIPWSAPTTRTQVERVLRKFGSARRLCRLFQQLGPEFEVDPSTIYKWGYEKERNGSGGVIPNQMIPRLQAAALLDGIFLTQEDLFPGPITKRHWDDLHDGRAPDEWDEHASRKKSRLSKEPGGGE